MAISAQLSRMSTVLQDAWGFQRVVIGHDGEAFRCYTHTNFCTFFPERVLFFLSCWIPEWYRRENRETIDYFYRTFGRRRIERISIRMELNLQAKLGLGLSLTRSDVEKIFIGLADVHLEDVEEILEVPGAAGPAVQPLAPQRTKAEYDAAFARLVPFRQIEDIFLGNIPSFDLWSNLSGSFAALRRHVFVCEEVRRGGPDYDERVWDHRFTKTTANRDQLTPGALIPHPRGYYAYWGKVEGGGACVSLFKSLTHDLPSWVKAHGTVVSLTSMHGRLSILDDFSREIGSMGVETTQDALLWILGRRAGPRPVTIPEQYKGLDPTAFRRPELRHGSEKYKGAAFSLGAANLSLLAYNRPTLFSELTLVCGPGISEQRCRHWQVVHNGPAIRIMIEIDDLVHRAGEAYLAQWNRDANRSVELVVFSPEDVTQEGIRALLLDPPTLPESLWQLAKDFFSGFGGAHGRNTTLQEVFSYHVFSTRNAEDEEVIHRILHDRAWEQARQYIRSQAINVEERRKAHKRAMGAHVSGYLTVRRRPAGFEIA